MEENPISSHPDMAQLAARGAEKLARFILTLAHDDNGVGAYVQAFVAGDDTAEAKRLIEAEVGDIGQGEREYEWRHRWGEMLQRRVDHVLDAIELVILPADPRAAFELLTHVIENDDAVAEQSEEDGLQPTFDRACALWLTAARAVPAGEVGPVLARLVGSDDYGLRRRLVDGPPGDVRIADE